MSYRNDYHAEIIADSIGPHERRLTTMEVTFPRFVLAEFNTHRVFSRNSASSRAIPADVMLGRFSAGYVHPAKWPREQKGMSGGESLYGLPKLAAVDLWTGVHDAVETYIAGYFARFPEKSDRVHKSIVNRMMEPWMWHTVIVSSTEWQNFFHQRCSPQAQPEIRKVADMMRDVKAASEPTPLPDYGMHLPYISGEEMVDPGYTALDLAKISTARCARVSYLTHDGQRNPCEDIRMFEETLWSNGHWSPMEHPAMAMPASNEATRGGNFGLGWAQVRQFAEHQCLDAIDELAVISSD